jgi:hypothetical protein
MTGPSTHTCIPELAEYQRQNSALRRTLWRVLLLLTMLRHPRRIITQHKDELAAPALKWRLMWSSYDPFTRFGSHNAICGN